MPSLSALRIIDLSGSVAGRFCARLFADQHAAVTMVEPSDADPPGLAAYLDHGKRVIAPDDPGLAEDIKRCDVLLVSPQTKQILREPTLPQTVVCAVSDFGFAGPRKDWLGSELIHQALSGLAFVTGSRGKPPLFGFGHRASYSAGAAAYAVAMAALLERDRSGLGQRTEVSVVETAAAMSMNLATQYNYNGSWLRRGDYPGPLGVYRCSDGWIAVFVVPGRWADACAAFGLHEHATDERFASASALSRNWSRASLLLRAAAADLCCADIVKRAQSRRVAVSAVLDVGEAAATLPAGPPSAWAPLTARTPVRPSGLPPPAADRRRPLEGIRVVELTTAWAGPMCGRILAHFGAEVVKVESRTSIDGWRGPVLGGDQTRYPDLDPGERPYDRNAWFNTQNHDKYAVELDLKSDGGREVMHRLLAASDLLLCNLAPGTLRRLGLDNETVRALRDDLVVLEIAGFEQDGPMARHVGLGPTIEATTGMMTLIGYGDGEPHNTGGAYLDPLGALRATGIVLTALAERNATGRGAHLQLSLRRAAMEWMGEYVVDVRQTGRTPRACANHVGSHYPHDIFPAAGEDQWIAVGVTDDEQWQRLCRAIDRPDLADDPALTTEVGRAAQRERLDPLLGAFFRTRDKHETAELLQRSGVPSAPVNTGADLAEDPHLTALGFFHTLTHPDAGTHRYQGLPFHLAATPGRIDRAAPCLGQDTDTILRQLGFSDQRITELYATGAAVADARFAQQAVGALSPESR